MEGLARAAAFSGAFVWGGDLVQAPVVTVDVTVVGRAERPVRRRGARNQYGFPDVSKDRGKNSHESVAELKKLGVLVGVAGTHRLRLVTHYWVNDESIDRVIDSFKMILLSKKIPERTSLYRIIH